MDEHSPKRYVHAPPPISVQDARRPLHLRLELTRPSAFSKETESTIVDLMRKTRAPFPESKTQADHITQVEADAIALENTLRAFQKELVDRERELRARELALAETEAAVTRRASELAMERTLIEKQRQLYETGRRTGDAAEPGADAKMYEELRLKLDEQARTIGEGKEWLREREAFLEESEATLFEKMQAQQERETELEQKAENIRKLEARANELVEKLRARGEPI